MNPTVG